MSIKKEKILVTGGAGFIGSHVVKYLHQQGKQAVIIDDINNYYSPKLKRDRLKILLKGVPLTFYQVSITNYKKLEEIFKKENFDKVCHLAARAGVRASLVDPFIYQDVNIRGTLNLLELSVRFKIKNFVYASSSSVYGGNKKMPFSENDSVDKPISVYATTKKADELLAHTYSHLYQLPTTGLRFFTVYGPWGRPDMALYKFCWQIKNNQPIEIYNQGRMWRDFTYIDDIVFGITSALQKNYACEVFNLGNAKSEKLMDLIACVEKEMGVKAKKKYMLIQDGDVPKTFADISKAQRMLSYKPKTNIKKGVSEFVNWFKSYHKNI